MIDTQKNITFEFKLIADCARYLIDNYGNRYQTFDSLCASISSFRDKKLKTFTKLVNPSKDCPGTNFSRAFPKINVGNYR